MTLLGNLIWLCLDYLFTWAFRL